MEAQNLLLDEEQIKAEAILSEAERLQTKTVFKVYKPMEVIGKQIKTDLLSTDDYIVSKKASYDFKLTRTSEKSGLLNKAYGVFMLVNLLDGFQADFSKDEKRKLKASILELIEYVEQSGYNAMPYVDLEAFKGDVYFIESLTWAFSCFMYAHRLHKDEKTHVDFDFSNVKERLDKLIVKGLQTFIDNAIRKDPDKSISLGWNGDQAEYLGWGAISGSKQVSLYFTNSVCETWGDVEDTILENQALNRKADQEYIETLKSLAGYDIIERFKIICKSVGKNIYTKYEDLLGSKFFYEDGSVATTQQIEGLAQNPALLNQLYVVLIPIYVNYHTDLSGEELEKFKVKVKDAVDMVYKEYNRLSAKGIEGLVNREYVSFLGNDVLSKADAKALSDKRINVSILESLIIRARAMIVTYVTEYPERELGEMVLILQNNLLNKGKWGWNDLQETERCVSALKEFYDYYSAYENPYVDVNLPQNVLTKKHKNEIKGLKNTHSQEIKDLQETHDKALSKQKAEYDKLIEELKTNYNNELSQSQKEYTSSLSAMKAEVDELKNGSPLEKAIKALMETYIKDVVEEKLKDTFEKLAASNGSEIFKIAGGEEMPDKLPTVALNANEAGLKAAFNKYMMSYMAKAYLDAKKALFVDDYNKIMTMRKVSCEEVFKNTKEGMNDLISRMLVEGTCSNNPDDGLNSLKALIEE